MPTQRTFWPYTIVATFVLFASYISYMVQRAMRTTVDLVSPDYYQQELRYQQRMESVARTKALPAPVQVQHEPAAQRLTLALPPALAAQAVQGQVHFFRPSDQKLDFTLPFVPGGARHAQQLSTRRLQAGLWRLRLDFTAGGQRYFIEKRAFYLSNNLMLWAGFLFGLLGSFHCVGMCGAIALALPGAGGPSWRYVAGRTLYNLGRVTTYATLGAAAGLLGQSLRLAGWQQSLSLVSGGLILLLVAVPERYLGRAASGLGLAKLLGQVKSKLAHFCQRPALSALYTTGLLNGLLPCCLVYVALAGALSAPGVAGAAGYMALFGLGTLPLMLGLSLTGLLVPGAWRGRLRRAVPVLATVLAGLFIVRGLGLGVPYLSPRLGGGVAAAPQGAAPQPATVHYCQGPATVPQPTP